MFFYKGKILSAKRITLGMIDRYLGIIQIIGSVTSRRLFVRAVNMFSELVLDRPIKARSYRAARKLLEVLGRETGAEQIQAAVDRMKRRNVRAVLEEKYRKAVDLFGKCRPERRGAYLEKLQEIRREIDELPDESESVEGSFRMILYYTNWTRAEYEEIGFLELEELLRVLQSRETAQKIDTLYHTRIATLLEDKGKVFQKSLDELQRRYKELIRNPENERIRTEARGLIMELQKLIPKIRAQGGSDGNSRRGR